MSYLYHEIMYASKLLANNQAAVNAKTLDGRISNECVHQVKRFLLHCKIAMQKMNFEKLRFGKRNYGTSAGKVFYIKSFWPDIENNRIVLYTRLYGANAKIFIRYLGNETYSIKTESGSTISGSLHRILAGIMSYYIPSECSMDNYKTINLLGLWRENPSMV